MDISPSTPQMVPISAIDNEELASQSSSTSRTNKPANLNLSTDNLSQQSYPAPTIEELTPPSSAVSSHDHPPTSSIEPHLETKQTHSPNKTLPEIPRPQRTASDPESVARLSVQHESITGSKRTASGQLKRSSIQSLSDLLPSTNASQHSRNPGVISNGNHANVQEISQQLRTRLTYAMLKVQNGWQARSLDEVESLASMSPRSALPGHSRPDDRHTFASPRTVMSAKVARKYSDSESSEGGPVARPNTGTMMPAPQTPGFSQHRSDNLSPRGLAPPADIVSGSRRRLSPNHQFTIPALNGLPRNSSQRHKSRPSVNQRTPSQNAAMEADAVETLLFMASPNNSGYNLPSSSQDSSLRSTQITQMSPLRAQFDQTTLISPKRVAFSDHHMPSIQSTAIEKAALIDRMLDGLPDESDEELENAFRMAEQSRGISRLAA